MKNRGTARSANVSYLLAGLVGTVAVIGLTILIYATFFQNFLDHFKALSPAVEKLIEKDQPVLVATILANLAHGFLIATVIRWGKFYTPLRGARAGAVVAFLTEVYFLFTQYALFKTLSLADVLLDTMMWTLINTAVGALVAWTLGRSGKKDGRTGASPQLRGDAHQSSSVSGPA